MSDTNNGIPSAFHDLEPPNPHSPDEQWFEEYVNWYIEACASHVMGRSQEYTDELINKRDDINKRWQQRNKYIAGISVKNKRIYLGTFDNEEDAAKAYDKKAYEIHGEFANLNFPIN